MSEQITVVVTSISGPNDVMRQLAAETSKRGAHFIVIGDVPSPKDFSLDGCDFYSLDRQKETGFVFPRICPQRHYARKNIGYLVAIAQGTTLILETDDDNFPLEGFWQPRRKTHELAVIESAGWVNLYNYFSETNVWPRGLSLADLKKKAPPRQNLPVKEITCPIQQHLADENPDVDALFRLLYELPVLFQKNDPVAITKGSWCPFNSQNTTWYPEAFELLYLPAYCSFRMTDIWRSFVAQRIAWENDWGILFGPATMRQERNEHDLMRDFADEVPGYLNNAAIASALESLPLKKGTENIGSNMRTCYEKLVEMDLVGEKELELLTAWQQDLDRIRRF